MIYIIIGKSMWIWFLFVSLENKLHFFQLGKTIPFSLDICILITQVQVPQIDQYHRDYSITITKEVINRAATAFIFCANCFKSRLLQNTNTALRQYIFQNENVYQASIICQVKFKYNFILDIGLIVPLKIINHCKIREVIIIISSGNWFYIFLKICIGFLLQRI